MGRIRTASTWGNSRDKDSKNRRDRGSIMHRALRNVGAIGRMYVKDYMWFVGSRHFVHSIWPSTRIFSVAELREHAVDY